MSTILATGDFLSMDKLWIVSPLQHRQVYLFQQSKDLPEILVVLHTCACPGTLSLITNRFCSFPADLTVGLDIMVSALKACFAVVPA